MFGIGGIGRASKNSRRSVNHVFVTAGQSNMAAWFNSPDTQAPDGKNGFLSVIDAAFPTGANNVINGATGSSAALKVNTADATNWWYDDDIGTFGTAYNTWQSAVLPLLVDLKAILWDQGETDSTGMGQGNSTPQRYKAALMTIFTQMRSVTGPLPLIIIPIGRRGTSISHTSWQAIRIIQQELAAENAWIHLAPEKFDLALHDTLHYTGASYATIGRRTARKVLQILGQPVTGADGPVLSAVSRTRKNVTVTLAHDAGTDITPATAISGFRYNVAGSDIAVTGAERTGNASLSLTLASEPPRGAETLSYGYNAMQDIDIAKLVHDTSAETLPLRAAVVSSITRPDLAESLPGAVFAVDATLAASYPGSGQSLFNTVESPADGATMAAYDFQFGSITGVDNQDPGFTGSEQAAYFTSDGGDYFRLPTITPFLKNLSANVSFSLAFFFRTPATWSGSPIFLLAGGNTTGIAGLALRYNTSANTLRLSTSDGTSANNTDLAGTSLPTDTDTALFVTYTASTKSYAVWLNSAVQAFAGTASLAKSATAGNITADIFNGFPSGSRFYRAEIFSESLDDNSVATVLARANTLHGRIYG